MSLNKRMVPHQVMAIFAGLIFSAPVFAYIGPGAGLSAIGSVLAVLGAVLLMILGFVWYPVKRLLARKKLNSLPPEVGEEYSEDDDPDQKSGNDIDRANQG
jgi:hypothetical protein